MKLVSTSTLLLCSSLVFVACGGSSNDPDPTPDASVPDAGPDGRVDASTDWDDPTDCPDADRLTDPNHCGRCRFSCAGAACVGGVCEPQTVIEGIEQPTSVLPLAKTLYWASFNGSVYQCKPGECADTNVEISRVPFSEPMSLTTPLDGNRVLWSQSRLQAIVWCKPDDCNNETVLVIADQDRPTYVVADVNHIHWITRTALRRCEYRQCSSTVKDLATGLDEPGKFAFSPDHYYWTSPRTGHVLRCPGNGCGPEGPSVFASGQNRPYAIGVALNHVYWTNEGDGSIVRCPRSGCEGAPQVIATGQDTPRHLMLVESDTVIWANSPVGRDGSIVRCEVTEEGLCRRSPQVIASGQKRPVSLNLERRFLFWANAGTSREAKDGSIRFTPVTRGVEGNL
jgi:hypothetical protein